ncbi:hypothetical protein J6590_048133, partial [Homalodisca vitripennis]
MAIDETKHVSALAHEARTSCSQFRGLTKITPVPHFRCTIEDSITDGIFTPIMVDVAVE